MLAEATKYGYVGYRFEARLALCEIDTKSGTAQAQLAALENEARVKGFILIARKASALRSSAKPS